MKNVSIYIIAVAMLAAGFSIAWFIKPSQHPSIPTSQHPQNQTTTTSEEIWTCSMHPQIRQNEPGSCPICEMDLIPLEVNTSNDPLVLQMTEAAVKLSNIQTTIVGETADQSTKTIRLSGKVQADERLASSQVAHIPGRIEKLYVTFTGEQVNKGQKLADLYSPELISAQSELLEALKLQEVNPKLLEAARNKLRNWKIGDAAIAAIEQKGTIQETFSILADASGIVSNRRVAIGDYVNRGEALFDLINLRKVWVLFDAYEEDLANIKVGDRIEFSTPSVPRKTFKTSITFIDPVINPSTRVAALRAEISNAGGRLKPEMFVNGTIQNKTTSKSVLSIPKSSVLWTGKRSVVYVKVPDMQIPSFQYREVELGDALGNRYQLIDGLEAGEEVVTYGNFTIDAAAQLNNQMSMMNKNVRLKKQENGGLPNYQAATPEPFKEQLETLANSYISLKDAFVATDASVAAGEAEKVNLQLKKIDMGLLKGEAHMYWMEQLNALEAHSKKITELNDVEEQRNQFDFLSQALINAIKVFGIPEDTIYVQHCPMANNDQGADWLSLEEEVFNPYFGDKMLKCGFVKDTITSEFMNPQMEPIPYAPQNIHNH